jgi:tetratricopeptide (TPR) repeat protein/V8-like Glu-specific endopeptidase
MDTLKIPGRLIQGERAQGKGKQILSFTPTSRLIQSLVQDARRSISLSTWIVSGVMFGAISLLSQPAMALSAVEVSKIAKSVTVSIDSENSIGSGVIVKKDGSTYTVLTAAHVVSKRDREFKLTTPDGHQYSLVATNIKSTADADLAVVKFQSIASYQIAKLGNVETVSEGSPIYVAGFPMATAALTQSIYNFTEGKVTANANRPLSGGYTLVYSNSTLPGMSGGPILNEAGETIAIHGKGDVKETMATSDVNANIRVKTGFNLGIPTNTFMRLASKMGVDFGGRSPVATIAKPQQAADFFLIGVDRFNRGNLGGSIEAMNSAIEQNPRYIRAYIARASANYMLQKIGTALSDIDQAIEIEPNSAIAHTGKCFMLTDFGNQAAALDACDRSIKLNPKIAVSFIVRGLVRMQMNKTSTAIDDFQQAIQLDPNLYYAYKNLAKAQYARRNILAALNSARRAIQLNPQSASTLSLLGRLLVANRDYQQALGPLDRSLGFNPKNKDAYEGRAAANLALGNTEQARQDLQLAKQFALSSPKRFIEDISFLNQ